MHPAALFLADMRARFGGRKACSQPLLLELQAEEVENCPAVRADNVRADNDERTCAPAPAPANDDADDSGDDGDWDDSTAADDGAPLDNARAMELSMQAWPPEALARIRLDDHGRLVRRWAEPECRRDVAPEEAAAAFLAWLREEVDDGLVPSADIVGPGMWYERYCAEHGLIEMDQTLLLNLLAAQPGVGKQRSRMNLPHLAPIAAYLARTGRPNERVALYRISPDVAGQATASAPAGGMPRGGAQPDLFAHAA